MATCMMQEMANSPGSLSVPRLRQKRGHAADAARVGRDRYCAEHAYPVQSAACIARLSSSGGGSNPQILPTCRNTRTRSSSSKRYSVYSSPTRRTRRACLVATCKLALLAVTTSACAMQRLGEAEVRQEAGVPCFTIAAQEVRRAGGPLQLHAVFVSDLSVKPVAEVWAFTLTPPGRTQLISQDTCVPYGQTPVGSEATGPQNLLPDRVYSVFLSATPATGSDSTMGYKAKFCLVVQPDGSSKVLQLRGEKHGAREVLCIPNQ